MACHPFDGRQSTYGPVHALAGYLLLLDEHDHACEQALEEVQKVRDGRHRMSESREERGVKDHLPLNASFAREERGGVHGDL